MTARLSINRDRGYADYLRRYKVLVDGDSVGRIKRGGEFVRTISAGRHTLKLEVDWCGSNQVEFDVADNEAIHFECGSNLRGWKLFKAGQIIRSAADDYIWLKRSDA